MSFASLFSPPPNGPADSDKVWRYIDLPKFLDLLSTRTLFASTFAGLGGDDPWEGLWTEEFLRRQHDWHSGKRVDPDTPRTREQVERANKAIADMQAGQAAQREQWVVSCWRLHQRESDAMWKAYTKLDLSVAIQTTFGRLREQLRAYGDASPDLTVFGRVGYDVPQGENSLHPFLHKRTEYDTDGEVRFVMHATRTPIVRGGVRIDVDVDQLVEKVWISPRGSLQPWFVESVTKLCEVHGLSARVELSSISRKPEVPFDDPPPA